jgi:hypothetical protein
MDSGNAHGCTQNSENDFSFDFLAWYHKDGDEFLKHIIWVTSDETWFSFVNVKAVDAHIHQTSWKRLNKRLPARKLMAAVFLDRKGVLMVEFMYQGTTIISSGLQNTTKNCKGPLRTNGVVLLHDSAHLHTAACTWALLEHFNWVLSYHPPYSLIFLSATTICLPTWRTCWDHSASTIMRSWWKVWKHGWALRRQIS